MNTDDLTAPGLPPGSPTPDDGAHLFSFVFPDEVTAQYDPAMLVGSVKFDRWRCTACGAVTDAPAQYIETTHGRRRRRFPRPPTPACGHRSQGLI